MAGPESATGGGPPVADAPPLGEPIETMVANRKSGAEADSGVKVGERTSWLGVPQATRPRS